jgi:hypothetical protein
VISGALTATPPASGAQVVLWRERSGQSTFNHIAQTTTNSTGQYTFTLKAGMVDADQKWYVTANGLTSATLTQHVVALVGLSGRRTIAVRQAMLLHGHVTPSHAGQAVLLEQRHGSHWTVIARPRLGRFSSYGVMYRFTRSGTIDLRAVLPGDVRNDQSDSPTFAVTVKP